MSKLINKVASYPPPSPTFTPESQKHVHNSIIDSLDQIFESPVKSIKSRKESNDPEPQTADPFFSSITAKARELKYNLQEWILMKSIVFSLVVFLGFVMLTYFILSLAGGYLPVIILSVLASVALRPTKDALASNIKQFLGIIASPDHNIPFFKKSMVFFIWKSIKDIIYYKQNTQLSRRRRQKIGAFLRYFNPTGDIYAIFCSCAVWILVSRFGIEIVLYIVGIILLADIVFRLLLDSLTFLTNQSSCMKKSKVRFQRNKNFSAAIDSSVATTVLLGFLIVSLGFIIFMAFLLVMDIDTIVVNLRSSITILIQNINQKVSEYSGIENAIDENFVVGFLRNYNESIYSYMENQDLKGVYVLFNGIINPVKNATANATFLRDFPVPVDNSSEFQDCLKKNRFNLNLDIMRDIEALYCSLLPYARRFSIDPLTTLKRIKEGVLFVFQLFFGTILFELYLFSKAALDYAFNIMIFCFCVYYLLHANRSAIYTATSFFPLNPKVKNELHDALVKSIKGSFLCSIKIFIYHFLFTWLCFDILQLKLGFTISIAASVFSMLPFIPSWSLCIPHAIYLYVGRDNLLASILLPVLYFLVSNKVYNDIYKKSIDIHPYVTGLSIVMGIYAFDVQGIIYGPILMCITLILLELIKKYGISTDTMLKVYQKKIIIEKLDSLERLTGHRDRGRKRSKSSEIMTPI